MRYYVSRGIGDTGLNFASKRELFDGLQTIFSNEAFSIVSVHAVPRLGDPEQPFDLPGPFWVSRVRFYDYLARPEQYPVVWGRLFPKTTDVTCEEAARLARLPIP